MKYFPVFLDLEGKTVAFVGGGSAIAQKLRLIGKTSANLRVFAPTLDRETAFEVNALGAEHIAREVNAADVHGVALAYIALGDPEANLKAKALFEPAGILVNVIDQTEACDFITPAIVDRAPLTVAISSDARAPALSRHAKAIIDRVLPATVGTLGLLADDLRSDVKRLLPDGNQRRRFWDRIFGGSDL
ncbi:MAG: bifunctional precorrin-2 dehydrogenase/sirohydrochlorin ferrochelatase, partial [Pseudomonadota bacterium]